MAANADPVLPAEVMDVVIDYLHSDLGTLGVCGMVCSEWLIRSRYHMFSTLHLWPWRIGRFFELIQSENCTFTKYVSRIEVDDTHTKGRGCHCEGHDLLSFQDIMTSSSLAHFSHIDSMCIRNVDWTMLPFSAQERLHDHLATFTRLRALEFDGAMFHDLREVVHITRLFPCLDHLVANVRFSKYIAHTISSAATLALPSSLEALSLGSDDSIPTILNITFKQPSRLCRLILDGVKFWHLQYIGRALHSLGNSLRHFEISFSREEGQWINSSDLAKLDLSHQKKLESLHLNGIVLATQASPCALETDVPYLISKIPSKEMRYITLGLTVESPPALELFAWSALSRAICGMDRREMGLNISIVTTETGGESDGALAGVIEGSIDSKLDNIKRNTRLSIVVNGGGKSCMACN